MSIAPVVQSVLVKADPARTFDLFVNRMEAWWPHGRTIGKNPHVAILLEQKPGGRWFERDADGNETNWGGGARLESAEAAAAGLAGQYRLGL